MPPCASLTTNSTPSSPRSFSERNTSPHACSPSLSPTRQSSTSRRPSAVNPTTTSTAWLITLPSTRTRSYRASIIRYGQLVWSSRRRRDPAHRHRRHLAGAHRLQNVPHVARAHPLEVHLPARHEQRPLAALPPREHRRVVRLAPAHMRHRQFQFPHPRLQPPRLAPVAVALAIRRPLVRPRTPEVLAHLR